MSMPSCLFENTSDTSVMYEKTAFVCFIYTTAKIEFQICSNKHETGLVSHSFLGFTKCTWADLM